jgi:hypothetical protein
MIHFEERWVALYSSDKNIPCKVATKLYILSCNDFLKRHQTKKKESEKKERVTDGEGKDKRSARA